MTLFNPSLTSQVPYQINPYSSDISQHRSLVEQAKKLCLSFSNNQDEDTGRDWKLVLLFIQVDDICACQDKVTSAVEATVQQLDLTLRVLHSQLKRTIVSIAVWNGDYDTGPAHQNRMCPCMERNSEGEQRLRKTILTQAMQESLARHLVEKQWYSSRRDFAVLLQDSPFITNSASVDSGRPSATQESRHTDELMVQMWANLLQSTSGRQNMGDNYMILSVPCPTENRPFLRTQRNSPVASLHSEPSLSSLGFDPIMGTELPCEDLSPSSHPPHSVHALRPGDIKVVAAVGDSLTAGNGIDSKPTNVLDVLRQYRGLSFSMGGDENLTTVTTLPNILKHFNPLVTGYSTGIGKQDTPQAFLNQAVAGGKAKDMPKQVRTLVALMKNDSRINFQSDWKIITVFIGGNDLCTYCQNSLFYSVENFLRHIQEALDYLHKEVPRAIVNLVEPIDITSLRKAHQDPSVKCPTWLVNILCPCVILPKEGSLALKQMDELIRDYQWSLNVLVESGRYDTHSNFTVVIQPLLRDVIVPLLEDGRPDRSYFSADCFHLSQKSQTLMARSLWNNMLEPLGNKTAVQAFSSEIPLKCPSKDSPFLQTYQNSNYTYKGPAPKPPPITNWGSDLSCSSVAPSTPVPTSVHKLRPADIRVVAALGDSITAGVAAKSKNILELNREYKGVSWSIGGDQSLETVTTLPNILKKFNPSLQGFSKGQGSRQKGFNMAVAGAMTLEIPAQIQQLIKAMKENKQVDFENDWKLLTIFVGGSDLCHYCIDQNNLTPKNYSHNLMLSLDSLYQHVPRVMVSVTEVLQLEPLRRVQQENTLCSLFQRNKCPCLMSPDDNSPELEEIKRINKEYQIESEFLISGDRYDGREDFTVVLQPYLHSSFVPYVGVGVPDMSFFSADCFHISERGHAEMAIALWNNMMEPVGRKHMYNNFTHDRSKLKCPSEEHPFIFTKLNSVSSSPVQPSTTVQPPVATTSLSPGPTAPIIQCDSSVPVWVTAVLAVVGLLIGWGVTWLLMSYRLRQNQRKKEDKVVEMKGTVF
ncbi:phospholipase B1, membrane-associated-like [Hypomesus transpacificus]|uniref:phospholipase B1, membrane-associated-like n=1 Tax=Hypomesus transpacificus TaxID=137520 RepID=UPI001F07C45D|nr:phospholipase B1, membrane-associated-like [Hypomesus transpacificus]